MRILSARILGVRLHRAGRTVEGIVALEAEADGSVIAATVRVSAPLDAPGAPPLRQRLMAAARLAFAARILASETRRAA
ncbi:MAG: hypothetical protein H6895_01425 [Defluviimonas sp.]|nr:hypothetical protein [Defluviimonas sp.]